MAAKNIKVNRSRFLPSLLDAFGGSGLQRRRRKLCDEALDQISAANEHELSPKDYGSQPSGSDSGTPDTIESMRSDISLLTELRSVLKFLDDRGRTEGSPDGTRDSAVKAYSVCIQAALDYYGIHWPPGVFKVDSAGTGSGPKPSGLGFQAALLYRPGKFGWRKVAKQLIAEGRLPGAYSQDIDEAAKIVQKAAEPWLLMNRSRQR